MLFFREAGLLLEVDYLMQGSPGWEGTLAKHLRYVSALLASTTSL
jgi:hypothetical protein